METFNSVRKILGNLSPAKLVKIMVDCEIKADIQAVFTEEQFNALYEKWKEQTNPPDTIESFEGARRALGGLRPSVMVKLMRACGFEVNAELSVITEEQFNALYEKLSEEEPEKPEELEKTEDTSFIEPETEAEDESNDGASEAEDEIDDAENEMSFNDDEGEKNYDILTGDDENEDASSDKSDWIHADDVKKKFAGKEDNLTDEILSERLSKCLEDCEIELPEDGMLSPTQENDIMTAYYMLYGIKIKIDNGSDNSNDGTALPSDAPIRPFVSKTVPPDDYINTDSDPKEGSTVYSSDRGKTPYLLIQNEGSGAEGSVYIVRNMGSNPPARENLVAKIYDPAYRTKRRETKVRTMINRPELHHGSICFPSAALTDDNGDFVGFLMMKADGMKLSLILEKLRKREQGHFFSGWNRKDLTDIIISVLNAFKFLHDNNILLGDVCLDNIMVAPPKRIYIVDTDSCQILPRNCTLNDLSDMEYLSERDFCISGYPCPGERVKYNSPEFQEALKLYDPSEIFRTRDDELFAVSVLLFEIVMLGRWPYDRRGADEHKIAKERKIFHYPITSLSRKILHDNRDRPLTGVKKKKNGEETTYVIVPPHGLLNLPQENLRMWDHLTFYIKFAFWNTFANRGNNNAEGKRFTIDDWLERFIRYSRELPTWADSEHDPANADLFPTLFCKLKYRTDEKGRKIKDENGDDIKIGYTECRFCHDRVDRSECKGKYHDECAVCWEEGTTQKCARCGTVFLITEKEAAKCRDKGNPLRTICDDCMLYTHHCSEEHEFRISRRTEEELYAKYRATLWAGLKVKERDYSMYCPKCVDLVICEKCSAPIKLTKRERYEMERDGVPFSKKCPRCMPVIVTCEECKTSFEIEKHIQDEMEREGKPFSSICPHNPETEAECERCGHVFTVKKHDYDSLEPEGRLYTLCPMGEKVKVSCKKCESSGQFAQYDIERYWAEDMEKRGEEFDCGKHKGIFGLFGSSGSAEPNVNHKEKP